MQGNEVEAHETMFDGLGGEGQGNGGRGNCGQGAERQRDERQGIEGQRNERQGNERHVNKRQGIEAQKDQRQGNERHVNERQGIKGQRDERQGNEVWIGSKLGCDDVEGQKSSRIKNWKDRSRDGEQKSEIDTGQSFVRDACKNIDQLCRNAHSNVSDGYSRMRPEERWEGHEIRFGARSKIFEENNCGNKGTYTESSSIGKYDKNKHEAVSKVAHRLRNHTEQGNDSNELCSKIADRLRQDRTQDNELANQRNDITQENVNKLLRNETTRRNDTQNSFQETHDKENKNSETRDSRLKKLLALKRDANIAQKEIIDAQASKVIQKVLKVRETEIKYDYSKDKTFRNVETVSITETKFHVTYNVNITELENDLYKCNLDGTDSFLSRQTSRSSNLLKKLALYKNLT